MHLADADRMLGLVAAEMLVELNAQRPSLSAKLPPPWGISRCEVDRDVVSLGDREATGILSAAWRDELVADLGLGGRARKRAAGRRGACDASGRVG
jgi:hypothetical protein